MGNKVGARVFYSAYAQYARVWTDRTAIYAGDATMNCQLSVLGGIEGLLDTSDKNTVESVLKAVFEKMGTPLILFDINQRTWTDFKSYFKKYHIVMESPFISTNGSKRLIVIINVI